MRFLLCWTLCLASLFSQTIEEKKASVLGLAEDTQVDVALKETNREIARLRQALSETYTKLSVDDDEETAKTLLIEVNSLRQQIQTLEAEWKTTSDAAGRKDEEGYGFWDQDESLISQLVMEYGSSDYLYIIPPELSTLKVHLHSGVPIPRESWSPLLEGILAQNGVGIKQVNAYARQLFLFKQNLIAVESILSREEDLDRMDTYDRLVYIFEPDNGAVKQVGQFFERFRDPKMTTVYQVGSKLAIISTKQEVKKLLTLYSTVWEEGKERVSKVFPLGKIAPTEMEKILKAFFQSTKQRLSITRGIAEELSILPLKNEGSIVVVGQKDMVEKAEEIVHETECQIKDPCEMTVYWYHCRHSDPIDVSDVLQKVYLSLINAKMSVFEANEPTPSPPKVVPIDPNRGTPQTPPVITPPVAMPITATDQKQTSNTQNFVPYPKTGAIMMVVRRDTLDKIKELVKQLDVPKKMVQIEILLFEKQETKQRNFGLNLFKLGSPASHDHKNGFEYDVPKTKGIFEYLISRNPKHFPAFDVAYQFLMSQEDVRINASPTILTLNQTPGQISIVEEISINDGVAPVETNVGTVFKPTYSRAQYGITIVITPTIHEPEENGERFVTLETNVTFDTTKDKGNDRPDVNRRHIENQVRIQNEQTVILGGLQRKTGDDKVDKLPFAGEIPGIGKLFSSSKMTDKTTELFMFITPHVILDKEENMVKLRNEELKKRPGDLPEFFEKIQAAKEKKRGFMFAETIDLMFGSHYAN